MRTHTLTLSRQHSAWLTLAVSLLIVATTISLTLFWPVEAVPLREDIERGPLALLGGYQSPQRCRECHEPEFQAWSDTTHAGALFDPIFQVYLQQVDRPGECFACHATGYDTTTGQFVLAGVTCEACHGPYRAEHPQESMTIASSTELCGSCHPGTLHEWRTSRHGAVGVSCIDCHEVHTQQTRAAGTTNALCAACHQGQTQNQTHATHGQAQLRCVDCHLARPDDDGSEAVNGQAMTGHSFAVFVKTCNDCHPASVMPDIETR